MQTLFSEHVAIVSSHKETIPFHGVDIGLHLQSNNGSSITLFADDGVLKIKNSQGTTSLPKINEDEIIIGESNGGNTGLNNILIGNDIASKVTEGNDLIAIGKGSMKDSSSIGNSIAIGHSAMGECGKTEMNIAIGTNAMVSITDSYNIGVGIQALGGVSGKIANHNISIGRESMKNTPGSTINLIALGTESASNISGNNFKSIYIGTDCGKNISSALVSIDNVGIGSNVLNNANDITDVVCIGSHAGGNVSGVKSVIIGSHAGENTTGCLNNEILIGSNAGSNRSYTDSSSILVGESAGVLGNGKNTLGIGNKSGKEMTGSNNMCIGTRSGMYLEGDSNICVGNGSGEGAKGVNNVCMGNNTGKGLEGSNNVWIGEGPVISDVLEDSVVIGPNVFVKGSEAVVIGSQVGKNSVGYLNRDILLGANAGMGQSYNDSPSQNRGILLIGANAGMGNPSNPEKVNSSDLVCLGHSAGHAVDQSFHKTLFLGNYAGSYAGSVSDSVVIGNSAGVGMSGDKNIFIGPNIGFNVKGSGNILIGTNADQSQTLDGVLSIGSSIRPTLLGDLKKGNVLIGAKTVSTPEWTDTNGCLGFVNTSRPTVVSKDIGVLYSYKNHLQFSNSTRTVNLTFPYKFISQGEMNGLKYEINTETDGGTMLTFKLVPNSKAHLMLNETVMLNVSNGSAGKVVNVSELISEIWDVRVVDNKYLKLVCTESVKGIGYLEAVGVHILKAVDK